MISRLRTYAPIAYSAIASAVFLDSLRFKFTYAVETQVIFGRLDAWAASMHGVALLRCAGSSRRWQQQLEGGRSSTTLAASCSRLGSHQAAARTQQGQHRDRRHDDATAWLLAIAAC